MQITYDVEMAMGGEKRTSLCSRAIGRSVGDGGFTAEVAVRRFVEIDRDNFNEVNEDFPEGGCQDTRCIKGEGELKIDLEFGKFDDFHPESMLSKSLD